MRLDGSEARAARRAARSKPIEYALGERVLSFAPEMPVDVLGGMDDAALVSRYELLMWLVAHSLDGPKCETECLDEEDRGRSCPAVAALRSDLRGVKVDGARITEGDLAEMWSQVRAAHAVTEGESSSSANSSEKAGDTSSGTASEPASTSTTSGDEEPAASDA